MSISWLAEPWQLLETPPLSAAENLAFDEVLWEHAQTAAGPCRVRFWNWTESAAVLGRFQAVENEIDAEAAAAAGYQVVRRSSGGGAMLVRPGECVTYSLVFPARLVAGLSIVQSYAACDAWCVQALRALGIDARHAPINDLAGPAGKIGGAAQARRGNAVLHHTMLACRFDNAEMRRVLRLGRPRPNPRGIASADKQVTPLCDLAPLSPAAFQTALRDAAAAAFQAEMVEPAAADLAAARERARDPRWRAE